MKKGFTLIELLAVIVILAVIALITVPMILNVVEESRKAAFKDSMYSAFNAVEYYVLEKGLGDVPESGIEAEFLNLKNNSFISGRFVKNIDGNLIAEFVSDGRYCATGSLTNLNVSKGECEISVPSIVIAVNGKEATFTITDDNGIVSYVININSEEPIEWPAIEMSTSITETKIAESAGTYYIHAKNKYGKVTTKEYVIEEKYFDEELPTAEVQVTELVATIKLKDDKGVAGYAVTKENVAVSEWISISETLETTIEWTATEPGNYDIHIKDKHEKTNKITFIISAPLCAYNPGDVIQTFYYSGSPRQFVVPCNGTYKLEVWGAQGGNTQVASGGKGGYSYGNVLLNKNQTLYVVVGGEGMAGVPINGKGLISGGYNGGGGGTSINVSSGVTRGYYGGSGGGATHIGTFNNTLESYGSTEGLYIVAGGGGGSSATYEITLNNEELIHEGSAGGSGGGETGATGDGVKFTYYGTGGSQTSGGYNISCGTGKFGIGSGSNVASCSPVTKCGCAGGGGGLYGGGGGNTNGGSGGGSGYIDGVTDGATENGVREGNGYAQITLVSIN